ncbi:Transposase IS200 like protein [Pseudobythopirellula maris]|uniref:Transposase IS200 like protein n=1 Tax=Pseudobythopirellula maris TaxID=2527991 RepID=A0A5C5ZTQ9_9BACT|nr:transposase [Pseudobythopirellula maris]TWT90944.1 Transposase IS200 like protein [Pseudobythopirellula maris]
MPNYRRASIEGGTFFFTLTTQGRRDLLTTAIARRALRESFREVRTRRPFDLVAIVLLPDHLHCLWALPRGDHDFSQRWSRIKAGFTRRYLAAGGVEAPTTISRGVRGERGVWQRRFYERAIRDETHLRRTMDYIHINPVKHGLVARAKDWPWSSFHRYCRLGEYNAEWGGSGEFFGDEWLEFE